MATVKFASATKEQLVELATEQLGLEIDGRIGVSDLRIKIKEAGFDKDEFEVAEIAEAAPKAPTRAQAEKFDDDRLVKIMIPSQEGSGIAGGNEAVPVGVNGVVALIQRGVEVEVPMKYVRVLQNCNKTVYDKDENNRIVGSREVPLYPFSILQAL